MFWIWAFVFYFPHILCDAYECHWSHANELACDGFKDDELSNDIHLKIDKSEVTLLNITKSDLTKINQNHFKDFVNLIQLHLTESQLGVIENDTFKHNLKLITLNLTDNYLENFQSEAFSSSNRLDTIDISKNVLTNLSHFNITKFPRLKLLILDDNGIKYLPQNLINKLQENNEFYLSAERNPWECVNLEWKDHLDVNLVDAFCGGENFVFMPKTREKRNISVLNDECIGVIDNKGLQNDSSTNTIPTCLNCSFYYCIFWFIGGIWIGIIVGNIFKIKKLLFSGPKKTFADVGIQCEYAYLEQLRKSDPKYSKHFEKKFPGPKLSRIVVKEEKNLVSNPVIPEDEHE